MIEIVPQNRRDLRRQLFARAAVQGGYFTAAQAKEIGYSYQAQAHHVQVGNWVRVDRGMFRLPEWIPEPQDDLRRWTLWSQGKGVVSHESALAVQGIGEFESPRIHLTVPPDFTKEEPGLTLHHSLLEDEDVVEQKGFALTTPVRSIVDVAARAPDEDQLSRAIEEAVEKGVLTLRQLRVRAELVDPRAALYVERAIQRMESRSA
jgi:predicted transcriptional regulator of viral defense system